MKIHRSVGTESETAVPIATGPIPSGTSGTKTAGVSASSKSAGAASAASESSATGATTGTWHNKDLHSLHVFLYYTRISDPYATSPRIPSVNNI